MLSPSQLRHAFSAFLLFAASALAQQDLRIAAPALIGALCEGLIGPLAAPADEAPAMRDAVQTLTLFALRAVGVVDAHARGLVVQTALPARERSA